MKEELEGGPNVVGKFLDRLPKGLRLMVGQIVGLKYYPRPFSR